MNLMMHNMLPLMVFWSMTLNKMNPMISLYPHTLQQMNTLEKMESDIMLTTTLTMMFLTMNYHITITMKKTNPMQIATKLPKPLLLLLMMSTILFTLLNSMNYNINTNNLTLKLSMKKFYQTFIILSLTLFFMLNKKNKKSMNRMIYMPAIMLTSMLSPAELAIMTLTTLTLILPIEMSKMMYTMQTHMTTQMSAN